MPNFTVDEYLGASDIVDWSDRAVRERARLLGADRSPFEAARACFEFVRDRVKHSGDGRIDAATCRASDVLSHGAGWCYAKSHLLAALLRANGIPAGFCYQRLSVDGHGPPYSLHGYNAVYLAEFGWYRIDARGNKAGVDAQFEPPTERPAFEVRLPDEFDFEEIRPTPLPVVVDVLESRRGWQEVRRHLPDVEPSEFESLGLSVRKREHERE
jgi:transglutaminase-like putative cysteine protease